jgi:hypothetical protein
MDAVEAYVRAGSSAPDAHNAALRDLGDARRAFRRFRKEHLTLNDARYLGFAQKYSFAYLILSYFFFGLGLLMVLLDSISTLERHWSQPVGVLVAGLLVSARLLVSAGLLMVVAPTFCFLMARLPAKPRLQWSVLTYMLVSSQYNVWALLLGVTAYSPISSFVVYISLLALSLHFFSGLRLWRKLNRTGDALPPDTPPPGASS